MLQVNSAHVKQLIRSGDVDKLEQLVVDGHGKKLIGEYSADYKTRTFLKNVPSLMVIIAFGNGTFEITKYFSPRYRYFTTP